MQAKIKDTLEIYVSTVNVIYEGKNKTVMFK